MSYKEKPQIKIFKFSGTEFVMQAIIDDFQECSFENNRFNAGQFSITINYNIPNAMEFKRGLFVQFGDNPYAFGEISNIADSIGSDGKGSQLRIITGYDARNIFKRRIIKNLNNVDNWTMTAKGEFCMRNLISDQCGANAEVKRRLPIINNVPESDTDSIGKVYSVSESFSNLYEVLTTIATQSEIGWRLNFNGSALTLEFYEGTDRSNTIRFDTDYESLSRGEFKDSSDSFANSIYVGGKGQGEEREIFEGETVIDGGSPSGLERFEAWDNQSAMTTEEEYEAEAISMLNQYSHTLEVNGQGLAKCPYEYGKEYEVGDIITVAFSGKSAVVQILSVIEHWSFGNYAIDFTFGKPLNNFPKQIQLMLNKIQKASSKAVTTESVKWYTIPTNTAMPAGDVVYDTIGFTGACASGGSNFTLYLDDEKTGAKTYNVYLKNLSGGKLTLKTNKTGSTSLTINSGTYVAKIFVDDLGNVRLQSATATNTIESGNNLPATSGGVFDSLVTKTDNFYLGNFDSTASSLNDALTRAFNAISVTGKTITAYFAYFGTYLCTAYKYVGGLYGMMLVTRNDGVSWTVSVVNGTLTITSTAVDSFEPTKYEPTINSTYVVDLSLNDGVSVYKTRNGLKVLTGYFQTKGALTSSLSLFTMPSGCETTRPEQLWIPIVSVGTGITYLLLFWNNNLSTWGGLAPSGADLFFIPPITYL